eukprot:scaffold26245_cov26-Prasinocladus_malaysianus.AAC.1
MTSLGSLCKVWDVWKGCVMYSISRHSGAVLDLGISDNERQVGETTWWSIDGTIRKQTAVS